MPELLHMSVVSSAGRHPARQIIRESKRMEKELVGQLSNTATNWPDLFNHLGRIVMEKGHTLSPQKLADEIDLTVATFADAVNRGDAQYGMFWGKRFGKRTTYREGIVLSHGHPLVDEDGISLWGVMLVSGRTGTNFSSTARSNLSEHALGRWIERTGVKPARDAVGRALIDAGRLLHHIDWPSTQDSHNEFNIPLDEVVLSGLVRGVITNKSKVRTYMLDIRTALLPQMLSPEQKAQVAAIEAVLADKTLPTMMQFVDDRKEGPIQGCRIPSRRQDWLSYDGAGRRI